MKLFHKKDAKEYEIYDITYDQTGFPQFLVFKNNQWLRMSAKHFTPNYEKTLNCKWIADGELIE